MKVAPALAVGTLAILNGAFGSENIVLTSRWMGSLSARANAETLAKRQINIGGLNIGGGPNSTKATGQAGERQDGNRNGGGVLSIGGLTLGGPGGGIMFSGSGNKGPQAQGGDAIGDEKTGESVYTAGNKTAAVGEVAVGTGEETQSGREAQIGEQEQKPDEQKVESSANLATQQAEQFSEGFGITVDQDGNVVNSGGDLGITQGSDGSQSIGGENGINIAPDGQATVAGNQME